MSAAWLKAAAQTEGVRIAGLVDIREESARRRAEEFSLEAPIIGTDLSTVLDAVKPDVVFDCTVPEAHTTVTLTALGRGCHVLGEKPLADSMENARRAVAAARKYGKLYAVIQNRRYDRRIRRIARFLASGAIGPITTVNSDFYIGAHFGGFRDRMEHVLLLDMAIHTFDQARLLTEANPLSVYCKEWNPVGSWYDHDASAVAVFEMTGGIVYTYRGSWCSEGLNTSWEAEWRIVGRLGTLYWDGGDQIRAEVVKEAGGFRSEVETVELPPEDPSDPSGGHVGLMREFVDCVNEGRIPETVCWDNIQSLGMVFGAIESAKQKREVSITRLISG